MSLSYDEALSTLQSMFADQGYTSAHLDAVLRHQGGHMENTVETLLLHGDGSPEELIRKLPTLTSGVPNANNNNTVNNTHQGSIDQDAELARQLAAAEEHALAMNNRRLGLGPVAATNAGGVSLSSHIPTSTNIHAGVGSVDDTANRQQQQQQSSMSNNNDNTTTITTTTKKGRAVILPNDFLRIPGRTYPTIDNNNSSTSSSSWPSRSAAAGGTNNNMMMTDEQLARMLQDELFQEEIRNNPEFRHLAGRRNPRVASGVLPQQAVGRSNYAGTGQVGGTGLEEVGKEMIEGLSSK